MTNTVDASDPVPAMPVLTGVPVKLRRLAKVKEALAYGRFGRTKLYELIAADKVEAFKEGGTTLVDLDSIDRYHASLPPLRLI